MSAAKFTCPHCEADAFGSGKPREYFKTLPRYTLQKFIVHADAFHRADKNWAEQWFKERTKVFNQRKKRVVNKKKKREHLLDGGPFRGCWCGYCKKLRKKRNEKLNY